MDIGVFTKIRPYLYHLTDRLNIEHISKSNGMSPAALLMERAERRDLIRSRRREHSRIKAGDTDILIRDQAPLHRGNLELPNGYSYEDLIESINGRIFFWPGTAGGPISYGIRHFERYREEHPMILRISLACLLIENPGIEPKFCRYNSGSPRCSNGQKSPRGPKTFVPAQEFNGTPSNVVEVTFESSLVIPVHTTKSEHPNGPWQPFVVQRR